MYSATWPPSAMRASSRSMRLFDMAALYDLPRDQEVVAILYMNRLAHRDFRPVWPGVSSNYRVLSGDVDQRGNFATRHLGLHPVALLELASIYENVQFLA